MALAFIQGRDLLLQLFSLLSGLEHSHLGLNLHLLAQQDDWPSALNRSVRETIHWIKVELNVFDPEMYFIYCDVLIFPR